jgi:hypothetical protein
MPELRPVDLACGFAEACIRGPLTFEREEFVRDARNHGPLHLHPRQRRNLTNSSYFKSAANSAL